jgi:DedD protein
MRGEFDEEEYEKDPSGGDKELTLGPGMLTFLGVGLLALLGLCFVSGYAVGRRAPVVEVKPAPTATASAETAGGNPTTKPSATQTNAPAPCATPSGDLAAANTTGQANPLTQVSARAMVAPPIAATAASQAAVNQQLVRPALPAETAASLVLPQTSAGTGIMVQVAVVSQQEDADVLVGALRKRGYEASVRRVLGDSMLHVQVGPFANRNDAMAMRQRLLNDGYNAVVQ